MRTCFGITRSKNYTWYTCGNRDIVSDPHPDGKQNWPNQHLTRGGISRWVLFEWCRGMTITRIVRAALSQNIAVTQTCFFSRCTNFLTHVVPIISKKYWGKALLLTFGVSCLQLSYFAHSLLRCFLETLSHCKRENNKCKQWHSDCLSVPDVSCERRCLQTSLEQLMPERTKEDKKSEFPSPGGSGVSRELGQKFKNSKIRNSAPQQFAFGRTKTPRQKMDNYSNIRNLRP